jgi:4-hydroxy-tetrahydrodipicolinate synthase
VLGEVLTAVVTPFRSDGAVDLDAFRRLCAHLVDAGSDGVVVAGTTGEAPTLTDDERLSLFAAAVESVGERATVVAGTGTYSTAHSVHLTERAHELGVDAFLVVTPYYNKPPARGIVAHFRAIAEATDRPIVVYNIPQRVVVNIEPETLAELAEIPNVTAVKQATTDPGQARRILAETDLALYAGNDELLLPFLELGGVGGVLVYTHVVGRQVRELVTRFRQGDLEGARAIEADLRPVIEAIAVATNPIPVKAALEATDEEKAVVREALEHAGVLAVARA